MARIDTVRMDISAFLLALLLLFTGFTSYFDLVSCKDERDAMGNVPGLDYYGCEMFYAEVRRGLNVGLAFIGV